MNNSISFKIIKIKDLLISLLIIMLFLMLIIFSNSSFYCARKGIELFLYNVVPSIFPFLVLSNILINSNILNIIQKLFNPIIKKIFNLPGIASISIVLGLVSGYPIGAKITADLYSKNLINKEEAERLLAFTNNSGPLFIISFVGISLFNDTKTGVLLLFTHIISAILIGIILGILSRKKNIRLDDFNISENTSNLSFSEIIVNSVKNSVNTILTIGGFIIFFSVIISILSSGHFFYFITKPFEYIFSLLGISSNLLIPIFQGIIELTNGISFVANTNLPYIYIVSACAFLLGFGGLSIYMQLHAVIINTNLSTKKYLLCKLFHGILASIFTYLLIKYTPFFNLDALPTYTKPVTNMQTVIQANELNLFLDIISLCFIFCVFWKMYELNKEKSK
ncbi:MAG: sporulation integral membrane protein YlbJ [Clostridiales bacterium]|nr:sporulation integral membrane protein YlbJ [Clostridiales bacterium]